MATEIEYKRQSVLEGSESTAEANIPKPTSVPAGEVMLCFGYVSSSAKTTALTMPAGWTKVHEFSWEFPSGWITQACWWKLATGSEPSTYTFGRTLGGSLIWREAFILSYANCNQTAPVVGNSTKVNGSTKKPKAEAFVPSVANTRLVMGFVGHAGVGTVTPAAGYTPRVTEGLPLADKALAAKESTGTPEATITTERYVGTQLVALATAEAAVAAGSMLEVF